MGAVTFSNVERLNVQGPYQFFTADVTMSDSYANPGGDTADINALPVASVAGMLPPPRELSAGYSFAYDTTNNKIMAWAAAGTEITIGTNLSGITFKALFYGHP